MDTADQDAWNHPRTADYYRAFCRHHARYRQANEQLIAHAALQPGQYVLDIAAGLGDTTRAALLYLHPEGRILCVEPSPVMRRQGQSTLTDSRVIWQAHEPGPPDCFDRILCGAALWQFPDPPLVFRRWHRLLSPGGALAFTIPAAYLGEPDPPGGGSDPWLVDLIALLARASTSKPVVATPFPDAAGLEALLRDAGFRPQPWQFRLRLDQRAYRDWLKIPPVGAWLGGDPDERARRIDAAFRQVDPNAWRWEVWRGWTAWKDDP